MRAEKRAKVDPGGKKSSIESEWGDRLASITQKEAKKCIRASRALLSKHWGKLRHVYRSVGGTFVFEDSISQVNVFKQSIEIFE
jgi:hypothetical protein